MQELKDREKTGSVFGFWSWDEYFCARQFIKLVRQPNMKKFQLAIIITLLLTVGFTRDIVAQTSGGSTQFIVSNQKSVALGQLTVSTTDADYYLNVSSNSSDTITISDTLVNSVTINNQVIPEKVNAIITLQGGAQAEVIWPTQNEIIVLDPEEL